MYEYEYTHVRVKKERLTDGQKERKSGKRCALVALKSILSHYNIF